MIEKLIRKNIAALRPYSSARSEFAGEASVFLDANESPYNQPYNRYPDPLQRQLKRRIARIKSIEPEQIFLGVGSDEPIDLLMRVFCEPHTDNIVTPDPTYGMYRVAADINAIECRTVHLTENFDIDAAALLAAADKNTKLLFLCSPNNPTGNSLNHNAIVDVIEQFSGIVVLDEAYIDFSIHPSFTTRLNEHANLVILQTFSKAWGMAGVRLGMAFASEEIIGTLNKIKYPYNIGTLTQNHVLNALDKAQEVSGWVKILLNEREKMAAKLADLPFVTQVYPSDANFILVRTTDANAIYRYLTEKGIVVRNRNNVALCLGCLRITIGTPEENNRLMETIMKIENAITSRQCITLG